MRLALRCAIGILIFSTLPADTAITALIVDGQNNHDWKATTPVLKQILEEQGLCRVSVATSPPAGSDLSGFRPDFHAYRVILLNYNGEAWSNAALEELASYVREGGGLVVVHAADNAFPDSKSYNEMIALGGWGGRDERSGPYVRYRDGKVTLDPRPGRGGSHGKRHVFRVTLRDRKHPITAGLPEVWMHAEDELYDRLRGPARNMTLLATAYSDPATGGTGEDEPVLLTVNYGRGRVFHTTLGHNVSAMQCVGFATTLRRGTEWAATGTVARSGIAGNFPDANSVRLRE